MGHGNLLTAILWSAIPAIVLLAGIYYLDRYEKEPGRLIAIALGAGAIVAPLLTAWIEKAFSVPMAVSKLTFPSSFLRSSVSEIDCRSNTAIRDSISAARGFRFLIWSKDIFHVRKIEFWTSESLPGS